MRRIAVINQKGGVGKTTTTANLGAALAEQGRRVVLVDMDAQANLSLSLGVEADSGSPTSYTVLVGETDFARALRTTTIPKLSLVPSNIDLSGAEMELASQIGREFLLRDALTAWEDAHRKKHGKPPADYVLFDCPPSLGLLAINALAASGEVLITLQTEFLALQGMSKLVEVVQLLRKRLNPELVITGILPCLYESRVRLAREVLGEIKQYFPGQVFPVPIRSNVKLAEAPSFGQTIFQYAPDSIGAVDYRCAAREMLRMEARDPDLAGLPPFRDAVLAGTNHSETPRYPAPKRAAVVAPPAAPAETKVQAPAAAVAPAPSKPAASVTAPVPSTRAPKTVAPRPAPAPSAPPAIERAPKRAAKSETSKVAAERAEPVVVPARASNPLPVPAAEPDADAKPTSVSRTRRVPKTPPAPSPVAPAANVPASTSAPASKTETVPAAAIPQPTPVAEPRPPKPPKAKRAALVAAPPPPAAPVVPPRAAPPAPSAANPAPAPKTASAPRSDVLVPAPRRASKAADEAPRAPKDAEPPAKPAAMPRGTPPPVTEKRARSAPRSAARVTPKRTDEEPRVVRADELPPLPPDAFEILSNFGLDP